MGQFALDLAAFAAKAGANAELVVRKVSIDILGKVILRSPVLTGRFRANWVLSFGTPEISQSDAVDKTGSMTIGRQSARLAGFKLGQAIYIMNSLPYGPRLEYEGWSKQAPAGMVRITVAEFQLLVAKAVGEVPK